MSALAVWNLLGPAHVEDGEAQPLGWRSARDVLAPSRGRPLARYLGVGTISDSHAVNGLTLKHLRQMLSPEHVIIILPSWCFQHLTSTTAGEVVTELRTFTSVRCLSKTLAEGDFHIDLVAKVQKMLEDEDRDLEFVDPSHFQLGEGDLGHEFKHKILGP